VCIVPVLGQSFPFGFPSESALHIVIPGYLYDNGKENEQRTRVNHFLCEERT
jgi:hypothetical protein